MTTLIYEQPSLATKYLTEWLAEFGFEVFVTGNIAEVWRHFEANDINIVIARLDTIVPSGIELVKQIRGGTVRPDAFIIVMGEEIYKPQETELMKLGVFAMLRLPPTKGALRSKIDEFLALRHHKRQMKTNS